MSDLQKIAAELRELVRVFPVSSASQADRIEAGDTIAACYVAGAIDQPEYREMMAYVR